MIILLQTQEYKLLPKPGTELTVDLMEQVLTPSDGGGKEAGRRLWGSTRNTENIMFYIVIVRFKLTLLLLKYPVTGYCGGKGNLGSWVWEYPKVFVKHTYLGCPTKRQVQKARHCMPKRKGNPMLIWHFDQSLTKPKNNLCKEPQNLLNRDNPNNLQYLIYLDFFDF